MRRLVAAVAIVAALLSIATSCTSRSEQGAAVGDGSGDAPPTEPTLSDLPANGDSQTPADAARDGVPEVIAALSPHERIRAGQPNSAPPVIQTEEGTWVVSSPRMDEIENVSNGCILGEMSGQYGIDYVCLSDYVEILLLEHGSNRILRAFPFADIGPASLLLTEDAIYCIRQGDGGSPDSMLCRIDRQSLARLVRVFPFSEDSVFMSGEDLPWARGWVIDEPRQVVLWQDWKRTDDLIEISGHSGSAQVDIDSLALKHIVLTEQPVGDAVEPRRFGTSG